MELKGDIVKINEISQSEIEEMYILMTEFYNDVEKDVFLKDLKEKDYCIILKDDKNKVKGFSTQKIMNFTLGNEEIYGVFSGDTIIDKENWGNLTLFKVFANFFFPFGEKYKNFYWFLIVKGYKTYKFLPTFYKEFYPNYKAETPEKFKNIMDLFGEIKYPNEYNKENGVIEYKGIKDSLKKGVADITKKELKDKNVQFFLESNPNYEKGNDLVCITSLKIENLKEKTLKILFT